MSNVEQLTAISCSSWLRFCPHQWHADCSLCLINKYVLIAISFEWSWSLAWKAYLPDGHLYLVIIGKLFVCKKKLENYLYAKQQEINFVNFVNTLNMLLKDTSCHVLPNFPRDFPFPPFVFPGKQLVFFAVDLIQFLRLFINWVIKTIHMGQDLNTIKNLSAENLWDEQGL